jgi:hypothetical protein
VSDLERLGIGLSANLTQLRKNFADAGGLVDRWAKDIESRSASVKLKSPEAAGSLPDVGAQIGGGADVGSQIGAGLEASGAQIAAFLNRFSADFNKVGATVIELAKRIDGELKFPRAQAAFDVLRDTVKARLVDSSGEVTRFGQSLDRMLEKGKQLHGFADAFASMGSVVRNSISGIRPERISFANPVAGLKGLSAAAGQAATSFKGLGIQVAASLGAFGLVYKAVEFLKGGVSGAANLNETLSKTDAILGDASAGVKTFADQLATKFGLAKQETLDIASAIGGLGKGLGGLSGAGLEKFTTDFTKLAADLSSFANTGLAESGRALTIGLSGDQSDVLKRLGVVMKESTIEAYAFANGIAKTGQELTEQQKVMARAGVIMNALKDAQGDLEKTADSAANQFRKLTGNLENLATSLGGQLLPYLTVATQGLNEFFGEMASAPGDQFKGFLDGIVDGIARVVSATQSIAIGFQYAKAGIADAAGFIIEIMGKVHNAFWSLIPAGDTIRDALTGDLEAIGADIRRQAGLMGAETRKLEESLGDLGAKFRAKFAGVKPVAPGGAGAGGGAGLMLPTGEDSAAMKTGKAVDDLNLKLKEQLGTFGLTARAAEVYKLRLAGATEAQVAQATAMGKQLDLMELAKKKFEDMKDFAKGIGDAVKTPLEKAREQIEKIDEAARAGMLTAAQAIKGKLSALGEAGIGGPVRFAGAIEGKSTEGRSSILQAMMGRGDNSLRDAARSTAEGIQILIELQREQNRRDAGGPSPQPAFPF